MRSLQVGALLVAAGLVIVLWRPWDHAQRPVPGGEASQFSLDALTRGIVTSGTFAHSVGLFWESSPWSGDRGSRGLSDDRELEFRLGAQVVSLHVALSIDSREIAVSSSREIVAMLGEVTAASLLVKFYRELRNELRQRMPGDQLLDRSESYAGRLERHLGASPYFALGSWAMAGWLAAKSGSREHFVDPLVLDSLAQLEGIEFPQALDQELRTIEVLIRDLPETGELDQLADAFGGLLRIGD